MWLLVTPWTSARQASLSFTTSQSLLTLMSTDSVMPSEHCILCYPFHSCPQSFPASQSFQWVSSSPEVAKVLGLIFSIRPASECLGLISFRIDWFDLAVQGTLKSLLEHRSSKGYIYLSIDKIVCLHWVFSTKSTLCLSAYLVFGSADHIRICTLRFRVVTAS